MPPSPVLATTALLVGALMLGVWLLSLLRRDASIVDVFWGLGFALIAVAVYGAAAATPRARLLAALTVLWGLRLGLYLLWRNWGRGEDYRYQAMRRHWGKRFAWISLITVFGLQGVLMWFISLPVQLGQLDAQPPHLTWLDGLGAGLWLAGFLFESLGDLQLALFKRDPANAGKVMDRGLWRYTRHPNYFGDALLWWGLYLIAAATASARWTFLSPVVMTVLLLRVSGVPLLEKRLVKTRPEYVDYVRRTSAFLPWPPRRR